MRNFALSLAFLPLMLAGSPAFAHDYKLGDLKIDHPWSRATPGGAKVAGGYMTITNNGKEADRLVGGTLLSAGIVEIHEMAMEGSTMRMRALPQGLEIKPGQTVELKPGGFHVMFLDLKSPLKEGETVKGTLVFQRAGTIEVEFKVEARGASGGHEHGGHGGGHKH
ncbi:MAG: copper chaperone PCu(A)C [Beijerinckiaceae bacterium]|nr:copper chaperone PCu(A)C [Beijerinckiaceae bacterium]